MDSVQCLRNHRLYEGGKVVFPPTEDGCAFMHLQTNDLYPGYRGVWDLAVLERQTTVSTTDFVLGYLRIGTVVIQPPPFIPWHCPFVEVWEFVTHENGAWVASVVDCDRIVHRFTNDLLRDVMRSRVQRWLRKAIGARRMKIHFGSAAYKNRE